MCFSEFKGGTCAVRDLWWPMVFCGSSLVDQCTGETAIHSIHRKSSLQITLTVPIRFPDRGLDGKWWHHLSIQMGRQCWYPGGLDLSLRPFNCNKYRQQSDNTKKSQSPFPIAFLSFIMPLGIEANYLQSFWQLPFPFPIFQEENAHKSLGCDNNLAFR